MLRQSTQVTGRPGTDDQSPPLQFSGKLVDLANFENTIFAHANSRQMGLGITHGPGSNGELLSMDLEVSKLEKLKLDRVTYEIIGDATSKISFKASESNESDSINHLVIDKEIDTFLNVIEPYVDIKGKFKNLTRKKLIKFYSEQTYPRSAFSPYPIFNVDRNHMESMEEIAKRNWNVFFKSDELSNEEAMALLFTSSQWYSRIQERYFSTSRSLRSVAHIGPLRNVFGRFQELRFGETRYVGQAGENTLEILYRSGVAESSTQNLVNDWFKRLGLSYEIRVDSISGDSQHFVGDLASLVIHDVNSKIDLSARDVGVGISQVIPVIVQSLIAKESTLLIEQPELHLHPKLQSEIGDLLIHSFLENRNQLIVETHSEHLLLRLMRRIREGDLPNEALKVVYVDSGENGSAATLIDFDVDGQLTQPWPNGFFEERLEELF